MLQNNNLFTQCTYNKQLKLKWGLRPRLTHHPASKNTNQLINSNNNNNKIYIIYLITTIFKYY